MNTIDKLEHLSRRFFVESFATSDQAVFRIQLQSAWGFVHDEITADTLIECYDIAFDRHKDAPLLFSIEERDRDTKPCTNGCTDPTGKVHRIGKFDKFCSWCGRQQELREMAQSLVNMYPKVENIFERRLHPFRWWRKHILRKLGLK